MILEFKSARISLPFVIIILFTTVFCSCSKEREGSSTANYQRPEFGEDILIEGVRYFELQGVRTNWFFDAKDAKFFQNRNVLQLDAVKATYYAPSGGRMVLTAARGYYETDSQNLRGEGGVTGTSDQGYQFWTESLDYDASTKEIYTPDKVTMKTDRLTIEGVGLKGSLETRTVHMLSSVKATGTFR
jgi:LPS export ABC transporter protein LptC